MPYVGPYRRRPNRPGVHGPGVTLQLHRFTPWRYSSSGHLHFENAESPIDVTLLGILTVPNEVHPSNALTPIELTLPGMFTFPKEVHP